MHTQSHFLCVCVCVCVFLSVSLSGLSVFLVLLSRPYPTLVCPSFLSFSTVRLSLLKLPSAENAGEAVDDAAEGEEGRGSAVANGSPEDTAGAGKDDDAKSVKSSSSKLSKMGGSGKGTTLKQARAYTYTRQT